MGKAQVDPAELRRFASELNRFNTEVQSLVGSLNVRLRNLEQTWRDQEQKKFTESFEQLARGMGQFLESSQQHVQWLQRKSAVIEEYLKQR
jgi:WXG100 family type VII secretion target